MTGFRETKTKCTTENEAAGRMESLQTKGESEQEEPRFTLSREHHFLACSNLDFFHLAHVFLKFTRGNKFECRIEWIRDSAWETVRGWKDMQKRKVGGYEEEACRRYEKRPRSTIFIFLEKNKGWESSPLVSINPPFWK